MRLGQLLSDGDELTKVQAALVLLDHRDFSGAASLWAAVTKGRLGEDRRIEVLGRLAVPMMTKQKCGSLRSFRDYLGESRIKVAYALAQIGEDSGWAELKSAAMRSSAPSEQLLALRLLPLLVIRNRKRS